MTPLTMFYETTGEDGIYRFNILIGAIWAPQNHLALQHLLGSVTDCRQWNKSGKKQQQNVKGVGSTWEDFPTKKKAQEDDSQQLFFVTQS